MSKPKLLIIDDDESIRTQMKWALAQDYEVFLAEDRPSALTVLGREQVAVVTLDLGLPPDPNGAEEGFWALSAILEQNPLAKVVILTGRTEKENALQAVGQGAYDFFLKPVEIDELKVVLRRALHVYQLEHENRMLQQQVCSESFEDMLGNSRQIQEVFASIRKVAPTDASVLIQGESGTGKELAARAIHRLSGRRNGPFVAINCGAIPENLLESELFGHEKGAFTGAHALKKGRIESAQGGTLFLDEIGDLPLPLQVKLLRFLQEQKVVRIGGRQEISTDARVLAATNMDLKQAMQEGRFREDLYYRLGVVVISLPPLREREGDVVFLAQGFLEKCIGDNKKKIKGFTAQALRMIESYSWPGNVRELENRIRRAVIMTGGAMLTPADLELDSTYSQYAGKGLKEARNALEKDFILNAMTKHQGNITRVAAELGISRPTLYELMGKLGIDKKSLLHESKA
ncbi:PEP-CTERM-box response regulator transcription factor [Desulforhabdus sp. TSK]|uniref:PEP-CTERM-box response regulator transcription factor n=1 Tax=Desulforhabdus sp. TSK TaxID=2925014 RepID=UPI001FC7E666|nr:PEP-CTERM-box response regulator transcription factor [Desulforhabdus sp. TSK]GKT07878.1 sigma-54-dependent Fis family transcriptional regulator [Desulforhabdus sp. TSK]